MISGLKIAREWAMANPSTMAIDPIHQLVLRYVKPDMQIVDPFCGDCTIANWRNDIDYHTKAEYHYEALEFLKMIKPKVTADLVLFDPPYSLEHLKKTCNGVGQKMGGIVISAGWNTFGMGKKRGFEIIEILCVCHGAGHNDTLVTVEKRVEHQLSLFGEADGE